MAKKSDKKVDFDLSNLTLDELIKTYDNISTFLQSLEDRKIVIEEKGDKNE